jgi:WD40 repeat protein
VTTRRRIRRAVIATVLIVLGLFAWSYFTVPPGCRERLTLRPPAETPEAHNPPVLAFSPDGTLLADATLFTDPLRIRLWDVSKGTLRSVLTSPEASSSVISSIAFSPDGRLLAIGRETLSPGPNTVKVWDVASGREVASLEDEHVYMTRVDVAFSRVGKIQWLHATTGGWKTDSWDSTTWLPRVIPVPDPASREETTISDDGRTAAAKTEDGTVLVLDAATGRERARQPGFADTNGQILLAPDGSALALVDDSRRIDQLDTARLWDVESGKVRTMTVSEVEHATFTPDGKALALFGGRSRLTGYDANVGGYGFARIWDVRSGKVTLDLNDRIDAFAFSPDGRTLAISGSHFTPSWMMQLPFGLRDWLRFQAGFHIREIMDVELRDVRSGRIRANISRTGPFIRVIAFSPDGKTLATAGPDGVITLWDIPR